MSKWITVYKDGSYIIDQVELDAYYRRNDEDWLVEIKVEDE